MEHSKICFKCNLLQPLSNYYKHKRMGDGHLNKCKDCTKKDTKNRHGVLIQDAEWVLKEQKRHREKYYRLGYKEKHKPSFESKKKYIEKYKNAYPEKYKALMKSNRIVSVNGHNHHWSYNEEHYKDVIDLTPKDHAKAHRFIVYDQERMMYRRFDTNELLDTRQKHEDFIKYCIQNYED